MGNDLVDPLQIEVNKIARLKFRKAGTLPGNRDPVVRHARRQGAFLCKHEPPRMSPN